LVKLMGGELTLESEGIEGKGSIFKFWINADEEISISSLKEKYASLLSKSRVLIVDDRLEYRIQLTEFLLRWGAHPTAVSSADEAILYCKNGFHFDVALIDIVMGGLSGVELVQEFHKMGLTSKEKKKRLWTIGISSVGNTPGAEFFDYFLCKPIHQSQLFPVLLTCLINNNQASFDISPNTTVDMLQFPPISPKRSKKKRDEIKILIVEDDKSNSYTLKEILSSLGFDYSKIFIIDDGAECIRHVKEQSLRGEFYDVLFVDILLPGANGFQVGTSISHMDDLKNNKPLMIAISASVQNSDKAKCAQAQFASYITKPAMKDTLLAALSPCIY
jgi:CheY-like chemotaxis protein